MGIRAIIAAIVSPVTKIITARQNRKAAKESARAKLKQAAQDSEYKLELSDQELERVLANGLGDTWKDEYATVSIMSILNIMVIGGVMSAYGDTRMLEGIGIALQAITAAGVDIGFLMEAVVLAAIGLSIWRKA